MEIFLSLEWPSNIMSFEDFRTLFNLFTLTNRQNQMNYFADQLTTQKYLIVFEKRH